MGCHKIFVALILFVCWLSPVLSYGQGGLTLEITSIIDTPCMEGRGEINSLARGGTQPYVYWITDKRGTVIAQEQSSATFINLRTGDYLLKVKDNSSNQVQKEFKIYAYEPMETAFSSSSCGTVGEVTIVANRGKPPFQWTVKVGSGAPIKREGKRVELTGLDLSVLAPNSEMVDVDFSLSDACRTVTGKHVLDTRLRQAVASTPTIEKINCSTSRLTFQNRLTSCAAQGKDYTLFVRQPDGTERSQTATQNQCGDLLSYSIDMEIKRGEYKSWIKSNTCGNSSDTMITYFSPTDFFPSLALVDCDYQITVEAKCAQYYLKWKRTQQGISPEDPSGYTAGGLHTLDGKMTHKNLEPRHWYWLIYEQYGTKDSVLFETYLPPTMSPFYQDCAYNIHFSKRQEVRGSSTSSFKFISSTDPTYPVNRSVLLEPSENVEDLPSLHSFVVQLDVCGETEQRPLTTDFPRIADTQQTFTSRACDFSALPNRPSWQRKDDYYFFSPTTFRIFEHPQGYSLSPKKDESLSMSDFDSLVFNDKGNYAVIFEDQCKNRDTVLFSVDSLADEFTYSVLRENTCGNTVTNIIAELVKERSPVNSLRLYRDKQLVFPTRRQAIGLDTVQDHYLDIPSGKYYLYHNKRCNRKEREIFLRSFDVSTLSPVVQTTGFLCDNGMGYIEVEPQGGAYPFTYSFTKTPEGQLPPMPITTSDVARFDNLARGRYQIQVADACGNDTIIDYLVGPLNSTVLFEQVAAPCFNTQNIIKAILLPRATYSWTKKKDNNFLLKRRTLQFESIQPEDTGLYYLTIKNPCVNSQYDFYVTVPEKKRVDSTITQLCQADLFQYIQQFAKPNGIWKAPDGTPFEGNYVYGQSQTGKYTYRTMEENCIEEHTVTALQYDAPKIKISGCFHSSLTLEIEEKDSLQFEWTTPQRTSSQRVLSYVLPSLSDKTEVTARAYTPSRCYDRSKDTLLDYSKYHAGDDNSVEKCFYGLKYNLYDLLQGEPNPGGKWEGPSQLSNGDKGTFDTEVAKAGTYRYLTGYANCFDTAKVTIQPLEDTIPPHIPIIPYVTRYQCSYQVPDKLAESAVTDNCVLDTQIQTPVAGTILEALQPSSRYYIKYTAIDKAKNTTEITDTIDVVDAIAPTIASTITDPFVWYPTSNGEKNVKYPSILPTLTITDNCLKEVMPSQSPIPNVEVAPTDILVAVQDKAINQSTFTLQTIVKECPASVIDTFGFSTEFNSFEFSVPDFINRFETTHWEKLGITFSQDPPVGTPMELDTHYVASVASQNGNELFRCVTELRLGEFSYSDLITPNNDGANDYLRLDFIPLLEKSHLIVFDRWGTLVWESEDYGKSPDKLWKGTYQSNNKNVPAGVYYYEFTADKFIHRGSVVVSY